MAPSHTSPHDMPPLASPGMYPVSPAPPPHSTPRFPLPTRVPDTALPPHTYHHEDPRHTHHHLSTRRFTDNPKERIAIISNLLTSEQEYVQTLSALHAVYIIPGSKPLRRISGFGHWIGLGGTAETVLPSTMRKQVFDPLERITAIHRDVLLPALDVVWGALSGGDDIEGFASMTGAYAVAEVLENHADMLGMCYREYGDGVWDALGTLRVWREGGGMGKAKGVEGEKEGKRVAAFMEEARADPRHELESLEQYVGLPLHRIAHYEIFLKHLARNTPLQERSRRDLLDSALAAISSLARSMEQVKRLNQIRSQIPALIALNPFDPANTTAVAAAATTPGARLGPALQPRLIIDSPLTILRHLQHETAPIIIDAYTDSSGREHFLSHTSATKHGSVSFGWQDGRSRVRHVKGLLCSDRMVLLGNVSKGCDGELEVVAVLGLREMREVKRCGKARTFLKVVNRGSTYFLDAATRENTRRWRDEIQEAWNAQRSVADC